MFAPRIEVYRLALVAQSEDEAIAAMSEIYDWLGWVQETLIAALD